MTGTMRANLATSDRDIMQAITMHFWVLILCATSIWEGDLSVFDGMMAGIQMEVEGEEQACKQQKS